MIDIAEAKENIHFDIQLGVHYHMLRQGFFEGMNRFIGAASVVISSSAATSIFATFDKNIVVYLLLLIVVLQSTDLFIDTRGKAMLHNDLRRKYLTLLTKFVKTKTFNDDLKSDFEAGIFEIEAEEPPVKRTLMAISRNDMIVVLGLDKGEIRHINRFKKLFSQFF